MWLCEDVKWSTIFLFLLHRFDWSELWRLKSAWRGQIWRPLVIYYYIHTTLVYVYKCFSFFGWTVMKKVKRCRNTSISEVQYLLNKIYWCLVAENNYLIIPLHSLFSNDLISCFLSNPRTGFGCRRGHVCTFRGDADNAFQRWKQMRCFLFLCLEYFNLTYP